MRGWNGYNGQQRDMVYLDGYLYGQINRADVDGQG